MDKVKTTPAEIIDAAELTLAQRQEINANRARHFPAGEPDPWLTDPEDVMYILGGLVKFLMRRTCRDTDWLSTLTQSALWHALMEDVEQRNALRTPMKHALLALQHELDLVAESDRGVWEFKDQIEEYVAKVDIPLLPSLEELREQLFQ